MNPAALHSALSSNAKGTARMALIVMAVHADHRGRIAISARDLGDMCGVSPQAAAETLDKLTDSKAVKLVEKGQGQRPSVYLLANAVPQLDAKPPEIAVTHKTEKEIIGDTLDLKEPAVEPVKKLVSDFTHKVEPAPPVERETPARPDLNPIPKWAPQNDVGRVLAAARVQAHPDQPLYWNRREHRDELARITSAARITVDQLCGALEQSPPQPNARRIKDVAAALTKGGRK